MRRLAWSGLIAVLLAVLLGLLGGVIGVTSAIAALVAVGGDRAYHARIGFGWLALATAIVATLGVLLIARRTKGATALVLLASSVGAAAIYGFYINTFYIAALPFWWLGAAVAWFDPNRWPEDDSTVPP